MQQLKIELSSTSGCPRLLSLTDRCSLLRTLTVCAARLACWASWPSILRQGLTGPRKLRRNGKTRKFSPGHPWQTQRAGRVGGCWKGEVRLWDPGRVMQKQGPPRPLGGEGAGFDCQNHHRPAPTIGGRPRLEGPLGLAAQWLRGAVPIGQSEHHCTNCTRGPCAVYCAVR